MNKNSSTNEQTAGLEKTQQKKEKKKDYVEGEILVKYKNNKINLQTAFGKAAALDFSRARSLEKKEDLMKSNISILRIKDSKTVEQKIAELKKDPNVEYVQPNFRYYPAGIGSNDTYKINLWGLDNTGQTVNTISGTNNADINAPEAWEINEGTGASIVVAVIDSGVAYNHPDLINNMWDGSNCKDENGVALGGCNYGYDYEDNDKTPLPTSDSHGTHVAGTIAALKNNSKGIIGVAPQAKIMALKSSLTTAENVKAINFAKYNGAKVINASWGGVNNDLLLRDAIALFPGLFIAGAGNGGEDQTGDNNENTHFYPSDFNLDNIISVTATDQNDGLANFSNYGAISVDVGAPGVNIYSTIPEEAAILSESFESLTPPAVPGGWLKSGTNSNWGTYALDEGSFWGNVLYGDLATPYAQTANTVITSSTYNLNTGGANIDFWTQCDTEYSTTSWTDYMALEISSDGTNFTELLKWDESLIDFNADPFGGVMYHFQNLSIPNQYLTNNFKFQFRWVTNSSDNNYDGCLVDDVKITKFSDGSGEKYDYYEGTSMAAPHVAGLAALIQGYNPSLSSSQVKNAILNTGDSVSSLSGKTVTGKRINAQKALQAINPAKVITSFDFTTPAAAGVINETDHTIAINVPFGTDVISLVPTIAITGASVSPASGTAQNFTIPVAYTVTAADGLTQTYTVTVEVAVNLDITAPSLVSYTVSETNISPNGDGIKDSSSIDVQYSEEVEAEINILDNSGVKVKDVYSSPAVTNPQAKIWDGKNNSSAVVSDGIYTIQILGTDIAGNTLSDTSKTITVVTVVKESPDSEPPVINSHDDVTAEATSSDGAEVNYTASQAIDNVDAITSANCEPAPGSLFPLGTTEVTCNKTDSAGNVATPITFNVIVRDTTPPKITLNGEAIINLAVGNEYTEQGATATDIVDGEITDNIIIDSSGVNVSQPGSYSVTYNVSDLANNSAIEIIRTVTVSDAEAPIISTVPNITEEATGPTGASVTYDESILSAIDDIDGSIPVDTGSCTPASGAIFALGTTSVVCSATDSSFNEGNGVAFNVIIEDTTAPTITILDSATVQLTVGDEYTDAGATASDIVDGDLTGSIIKTGTFINSATAGAFTIIYNVSDAAGNSAAEVIRMINVSADGGDSEDVSIPSVMSMEARKNVPAPVLIAKLLITAEEATGQSVTLTSVDSLSEKGGNIFRTDTSVVYMPPKDYLGEDSFKYVITIDGGRTEEILVKINVTEITFFQPVSKTQLGNGKVLVNFITMPNVTLTILVSVDKINWTLLGVATSNSAGQLSIEDIETETERYYLTGEKPSITSFSFPSGTGVINEANHTIVATVPFGTDVRALVPTFVTTGASVSVGSTWQVTGVTANDFTNPIIYRVTAENGTTEDYVVSVIIATATQTVPSVDGVATVNNTTPQVVITNANQATAVTISDDTTNPTINVSSFITAGVGTLPAITIASLNANNTNVSIPASTIVASADNTWNGIISAPTVTTVALPAESGQTKTLSTAIEVGFAGAKLSFDKGVRILLKGQAGKKAGYIRTGISFTEITNTCGADNQVAGDALAEDGDCKIDAGSDLVIWTKHFTSFATYTQTTNNTNNGGGGGNTPVITTVPAKKGDGNGDNKVDKYDFALLMSSWGKTGSNASDFNGDRRVDKYDFALLMSNWGL